jgi:hypothetical protein
MTQVNEQFEAWGAGMRTLISPFYRRLRMVQLK